MTVLIAINSVHDVLYIVEKNALKRNQESLKTSLDILHAQAVQQGNGLRIKF